MRGKLLVLLWVLLAGCSDDDSSGPPVTRIPGSYTLQTINARPLPFILISVGTAYVLEQRGGTMTLNENNTYREENQLRETFNDAQLGLVSNDTTIVFTGTWAAEDSVLILTSSPRGLMSFGYVSGNRLTLSFESGDSLFTYVYGRK